MFFPALFSFLTSPGFPITTVMDLGCTVRLHWTPQEFALPSLPGGLMWHLAADTDDAEQNGFMPEGREPLLEDQRRLTVQPRSIAVVMGKPGKKEKRGGKNVKTEKQ